MIRPALELAWAVAKLGGDARPPVPPPGRLRPLMRFAKLPDRALSTVRQVVDDDDEFRSRVAQVAEEAALERPSWLWLVRPEGWAEDLGALVDAAGAAALEVQAEKEERTASRRLAAAEAATARAEADLKRLRSVNAELTEEVAAERLARRRLEAERAAMEAATHTAEADARRRAETMAPLESRIASLGAELDQKREQLAGLLQERDAARAEVDHLRAELERAGTAAARQEADQDDLRVHVGRAVGRAAGAARQLSEALAEVARSVHPESTGVDEFSATALSSGSDRVPPAPVPAPLRPVPAEQFAVRREPMPLPPAVFDDSLEAADYLVRAAGMLLVVDGYNVTLSSWPHLELPRQRQRLVDALVELAMRAGTTVRVVFDGTDVGGLFGPTAAARHRVRTTFSPDGVEADEVIIDLVDRLDPSRPVTVATDDRRVRDEVRRRGANVISVAQLLGVLGRTPGSATGDPGSVAR
jgi:predicted RNA-binding protein with PIN domain